VQLYWSSISLNQNNCSQTLSKLARFAESGDKFANVANLKSTSLQSLRHQPEISGLEILQSDSSAYPTKLNPIGNGNAFLFHMTQPTSRSTTKTIACSKPIISEN